MLGGVNDKHVMLYYVMLCYVIDDSYISAGMYIYE